MPKKKKENPVFTYKVVVLPVYSPTKWAKGEWEKDKEAIGEAIYTGLPERELQGYQPVMMAYLDGKKYGIAQGLGGTFPDETAALGHVAHYYPNIKIGNQFKPDYQGLLAGEIVE